MSGQDRARAFEIALTRTEADPAEDGAETNHDCQSHQPRDPAKPARRRRRKAVGILLVAANNPADRHRCATEPEDHPEENADPARILMRALGTERMTPEATTAKKAPMAAVTSPSTMFSFFWLAHLRVHKRPLKAAIRLKARG